MPSPVGRRRCGLTRKVSFERIGQEGLIGVRARCSAPWPPLPPSLLDCLPFRDRPMAARAEGVVARQGAMDTSADPRDGSLLLIMVEDCSLKGLGRGMPRLFLRWTLQHIRPSVSRGGGREEYGDG